MSDKKQTAVEWLDSNLIHAPHSQEDFTHNYRVFEQAKQMEKEQIKEAFKYGEMPVLFINFNADYYYQNIYGTDQSIEENPNQEASN
jgi:hypothetical protein